MTRIAFVARGLMHLAYIGLLALIVVMVNVWYTQYLDAGTFGVIFLISLAESAIFILYTSLVIADIVFRYHPKWLRYWHGVNYEE